MGVDLVNQKCLPTHLLHLAFFSLFFTLIAKAATISVNKKITVEKRYSSLKPRFTLTIPLPALQYYTLQLLGHYLLHMVKVKRCTCPAKTYFRKFRISDRFFVLLKSTESLSCTKTAIKRIH